jgi:hypothetical protein
MKRFLVILALLAGCGGTDTTASGIDMATAPCVKNALTTAQGCYTSEGVYAQLGANPCMDTTKHPECSANPSTCCWNPVTNKCFPSSGGNVTGVNMGAGFTSCETGTSGLQNGDSVCSQGDSRFAYNGNSTGGMVCLTCTDFVQVNTLAGIACESYSP